MEDPLRKLPSKSVGTFFGVLNLNIYAWYSQRFFSFTTPMSKLWAKPKWRGIEKKLDN
jgi:hypothetical protein